MITAVVVACLLFITIVKTWDWSVFWTALSAIATFAAAGIALWLPFHQQQERQREEEDNKRKFYWDVFYEIERALHIYDEAERLGRLKPARSAEMKYQLDVRSVEERALNSRKVIEHLLRRDGIADGVIRRALDAVDLNIEVANSVQLMYRASTRGRGSQELGRHLVRRNRVLDGIDKHKSKFKLPLDLSK